MKLNVAKLFSSAWFRFATLKRQQLQTWLQVSLSEMPCGVNVNIASSKFAQSLESTDVNNQALTSRKLFGTVNFRGPGLVLV